MKRSILGLAAAAAMLAFGAGDVRADGELHIYNWGNYTNPELISKFEEMYGVTVTLDG